MRKGYLQSDLSEAKGMMKYYGKGERRGHRIYSAKRDWGDGPSQENPELAGEAQLKGFKHSHTSSTLNKEKNRAMKTMA